jgi:hypothetical protein
MCTSTLLGALARHKLRRFRIHCGLFEIAADGVLKGNRQIDYGYADLHGIPKR